nr:hypothetical protein Iba_chr04dCG16430 [Ipomoea batatas]
MIIERGERDVEGGGLLLSALGGRHADDVGELAGGDELAELGYHEGGGGARGGEGAEKALKVGARRTLRELRCGWRGGIREAPAAEEALRWLREDEEMKDKVAMTEAEMRGESGLESSLLYYGIRSKD